ncbi:transposase [Streptomyces albicerus]|uniref:transposase n=1 Tax=Streptomyces albicerus TaxID=2569859 RepID=UPI001CED3E0A
MLGENGPVTSPVELTLWAEHRRGHGALYDALNHCRVGVAAGMRRALAALPQPNAADRRLVLAGDASPWLRTDAPTSRDRRRPHPRSGSSVEAVQRPTRVNVTCVTPLGEEAASTS